MSALLVEIERGILTARERKNQRWFPRWFTYTIREEEKIQWKAYVNNHPIELGYGPDNNPNPTIAGPRTDNNPKPTIAVPHTQGATTSRVPSPNPSPTTKPTLRTRPTMETVPGSATLMTLVDDPSPVVTVASTSRTTLTEAAPHKSGESEEKEEIVSQKCEICELVGTKLCTGCRRARYCSAEHQRQDWVAHKKLCVPKASGKLRDLQDSSTAK